MSASEENPQLSPAAAATASRSAVLWSAVALQWSSRLAALVAAGTMVVGGAVLLGWFAQIDALKSVIPGMATMKANTALAFVLAGLSLWLQVPSGSSDTRRHWARTAAGAVVVLAIVTRLEYVFAATVPGIDQGIARDLTTDPLLAPPGRMSSATADSFILLGLALLLLELRWRRRYFPAETLAILAGAIGAVGLLGQILDAGAFYQFRPFSSMALHTAGLFVLLAMGVLGARPARGLMSVLNSSFVGGRIARITLPLVTVVIVGAGWMRLAGERAGWFNAATGLAIFVIFALVTLFAFVWLAARYANRLHADVERRGLAAARLAAIVESSHDAIIGKDVDGILQSWNPGAERIFGYRADEMIGQSILRIVPDDLHDEERSILARLRRGERIEHFETRRRHRDGRDLWVSITVSPIRDGRGQVVGASNVARDLTAEIQARRAREEQAILLRAMSALAHVGGWSFDPATGEGTWTEEVARIYDRDPAAATNRELGLEVFHGGHRARIEQALAEVTARGTPYDLELELVTAAGRRKWVRTQGEAEWRDGRVVRVHGSIQDITDRREMETALRLSEAKFAQAFAHNPAAIALTELDGGKVLEVNETWLEMFGYTRAEVVGRSMRSMWPSPDDAARFVADLADRGLIRGREQEFRRKSGELLATEYAAHRIEIDGRTVVLTTLLDITERKAAQEELARSNQDLEQFAYVASHDL